MAEEIGRTKGPTGSIAFRRIAGEGPCVVFLGGFRSDMSGTKATALAHWALDHGRAFLRFDYSGHGASEGRFEDGAVSDWTEDARVAITALTEGPLCLVGSSMGAWIGALLARSLKARIAGAVFVAPAPDFTERLLLQSLSPEQRRAIDAGGRLVLPSAYGDEPEIFTRRLLEDGRAHCVLPGPISFDGPVRILHGKRDRDVPWPTALDFAAAIDAPEINLTLIDDGDHRLSREHDLRRLVAAVAALKD